MSRERELSPMVGIGGAYSRRTGEYPPRIECAALRSIEIAAILKSVEKHLMSAKFLDGYKVRQNAERFDFEIGELCAAIAKDAPQ